MPNTMRVTEGEVTETQTMRLERTPITGYLAWHRLQGDWYLLSPNFKQGGNPFPNRGLFYSTQEIEARVREFYGDPDNVEIKIVKVEL